MEILLSSLVGGVVGLLLAVIFDESLRLAKRRLIKRVRTIFYRPRSPIRSPETFALGRFTTSWLVIDGDGDLAYTPETIECRVNDTPVLLPSEILQIRAKVEKREADKKERGLHYQWNGPLYALERYAVSRTIPDEHMQVVFTFRLTDYFTFQATVMSLDSNLLEPPAVLTLRQKYLQGCTFSEPIPFLANGFGIALVILTKDRKFILSRRAETAGTRLGELDVSVVEGVHPILDRASSHRGPDLYRTAIRGAQEEVGITLIQSDITFLGFGMDVEYYQWGVIGVARIAETAQQALEGRTRGTGGKWETKKFEIIDAEPRSVFHYLRDERMWSLGLVAIYWALIQEYGKRQVDAVAAEIFR